MEGHCNAWEGAILNERRDSEWKKLEKGSNLFSNWFSNLVGKYVFITPSLHSSQAILIYFCSRAILVCFCSLANINFQSHEK